METLSFTWNSVVGEGWRKKVSDHGENKNSRLHTGEDIREGGLKGNNLKFQDTLTLKPFSFKL